MIVKLCLISASTGKSATLPASPALRAFPIGRLRLGRPLHSARLARLDIRPARAALEAGDLVAQRRHRSLQLGDHLKLRYYQARQLSVGQAVKIARRYDP